MALMQPSSKQLSLLSRLERLSFRFCDAINRVELLKRASHQVMRHFGSGWVHASSKNLQVIEGLDHVRELNPSKGVLVVSNHRSFFDMYVITSILFRNAEYIRRIYFPVRSEFFYDRISGLLVNGIMSGWAMYPPILRQPERTEFNKFAMARIVELLQERGSIVGFHPEGTRNKTDDPYTLLPAQPGVGQLVMRAQPIVLPVFILGLTNRFLHQIKSNFDRTGREIIIVFGAPMDLERFYAMPPRLRTYMEISRAIRDAITDLGKRERALRLARSTNDDRAVA